jgi:hypothetical protein
MQRSQVEDESWTDVASGVVFARPEPTPRMPTRRWPALYWGISCVVHLLLLVAAGGLPRPSVNVPPATPIRVSILPTIGTSAQASPVEDGNATLPPRMPEPPPSDTAASPHVSPFDPDQVPSIRPHPPLPTPMAPEGAVAPAVPATSAPEWLEAMPEVRMIHEPPSSIEPL